MSFLPLNSEALTIRKSLLHATIGPVRKSSSQKNPKLLKPVQQLCSLPLLQRPYFRHSRRPRRLRKRPDFWGLVSGPQNGTKKATSSRYVPLFFAPKPLGNPIVYKHSVSHRNHQGNKGHKVMLNWLETTWQSEMREGGHIRPNEAFQTWYIIIYIDSLQH